MNTRPLNGLRVLDLSRILAGPWATQWLADMGAEVIKVERPGRGDDTRGWGPPWHEASGEAAYFLSANRGKQSVAIDITAPEGQQLVRELVQQCDVLVENFKQGGLKKYGLDYDSLQQIKPDLIYCSITGFGQTGPYAHRAGYDFLVQGMGGLMSLTGQPDNEPGGGPVKVGVALTDIFAGMYAANAVLAAVVQRDRTGEGSWIDISLLDVQVAVLANQAQNYLTSGDVPQRMGNAHPNIVPYQAFATQDGHMILTVGNDDQFRRLCEALSEPELAQDERFVTNASRVAHRRELIPLLEPLFLQASTDHWVQLLEGAGVPCGPINTIDRVFADPQVEHRELLIERHRAPADPSAYGDGHGVRMVGNPVKLNGQAMNAETAPPMLGADTTTVLQQLLDKSEQELSSLRAAGII
ncbi:MAG: CoA transferase [Natronospirillum sp.]|uniref:CaiB/BaiF CoA transferase family protein n=1 Tax=Natronospirillum sp. TaxID=2812955 RepID=UPI0025D65FC1|nr:CaiB/BaiF CoA-transferase family protein [Natronospirillum sp.]MCH8551136.1 CoA transferase [Natronospirillum sp.]